MRHLIQYRPCEVEKEAGKQHAEEQDNGAAAQPLQAAPHGRVPFFLIPIASSMTSVRDSSILITGQRRGKYNRQTLVSADEANRRLGKEFRLNREPLRSDNTGSKSLPT
jgi:hypothetical protein